jgi:flagellar protein FlaG
MALNPLSGNFQPPSSVANGKPLPAENYSVQKAKANETSQNVTSKKLDLTVEKAAKSASSLEKLSVEELNQRLAPISQNIQRGLRFQVDDVTGDTVISVIDRQTEETIRQIPPEELLTLSKRLKEVSEELDSVRGILIQTDA